MLQEDKGSNLRGALGVEPVRFREGLSGLPGKWTRKRRMFLCSF